MTELKILTEVVIDIDAANDQHCGPACKWRVTSRGGYVQCFAFVPNLTPLFDHGGHFRRSIMCLLHGSGKDEKCQKPNEKT